MPIGLEEWRARIGLFNASHMPRSLVASKGRKYQRTKWTSLLLSLCLAVVQLLSRIARKAINTGHQMWVAIRIGRWRNCLATSCVFRTQTTVRVATTKERITLTVSEMPIGLEEWRARIGLFYASRTPRSLAASKGRKYRRTKWTTLLLSLCLAVVQLLSRIARKAINTGHQMWEAIRIGRWRDSLATSCVFRPLSSHSSGVKRGLSLLLTCLMVVQMLLIIAGDVELNPGPLTREAGRLEVRDLKVVRKELVNVASKWYDIGLELDIHPDTLRNIKEQESNLSVCLREMLERWLKQVDPQPTWEALATALESSTVGESHLAEQLRGKYCKPQEEEESGTQGKSQEEQSHTISLQVEKRRMDTNPSVHLPLPIVVAPPPALPPMDEYASYLKSVYMSKKLPTYSKWPPTSSKEYIHLAVVKKKRVSKKEADQFTRDTIHGNIDDIFQRKESIDFAKVGKKEDGSVAQFILIEGAPGIGKTTFAWELCQRWVKGEILRQYKAVVLLRLRDKRVREAKDAIDLFYHLDPDLRSAVAKHILQCNGDSILLLFEGYDELPGKLQTQESIFLDILYKNILPKATVLVTSRPVATEFLRKEFKEQISQHIEILGFTKRDIQSYIHSVMDDSQVQEDFTQYLKCYPYIQGMMYVPLNAVIVAEVYKESRESPDKFIPTTMTELYTALTKNLLLRYLGSHSEYGTRRWRLKSFVDLPREIYEQFCKISTIAFKGMIRDEFIFDDLPENFNTLDLMQSVPELYVKEGALVSYNFFHLTLQEYLAAVHISHQRPEEQIEYFRGSFQVVPQPQTSSRRERRQNVTETLTPERVHSEYPPLPVYLRTDLTPREQQSFPLLKPHPLMQHIPSHGSLPLPLLPSHDPTVPFLLPQQTIPTPSPLYASQLALVATDSSEEREENLAARFNNVLRFGAGLTKFENFSTDSLRPLLIDGIQISLDALHWLFEAQCIDTYNKVISDKILVNEYESEGSMTLFDCFVLGHAISHINCTWKVNLYSCQIGNEGLEMLVAGMHYNKHNCPQSHLPVPLDLTRCDITPEGLHCLTEMPEHVIVTKLNLSYNPIGGGVAHFFTIKLSALRSLQTLDLCFTKITSEDTKALAKFLSQPDSHQLEVLNLGVNDLSPEDTGQILGALPHNTTLTDLYLDQAHVCKENVLPLTRALRKNCAIKILCLNYCKMDTDVACDIASTLCLNSTLGHLVMAKNPIGPRGAAAFTDMLKKNRTLQYLDLRGNSIGEEGAAAFADMLKTNRTLQHLDLDDDSIGEEGASQLVRSLQFNTTLRKLVIPEQYKSSLPPELYTNTQGRVSFVPLFP